MEQLYHLQLPMAVRVALLPVLGTVIRDCAVTLATMGIVQILLVDTVKDTIGTWL
jgi:hypothetical protein